MKSTFEISEFSIWTRNVGARRRQKVDDGREVTSVQTKQILGSSPTAFHTLI